MKHPKLRQTLLLISLVFVMGIQGFGQETATSEPVPQKSKPVKTESKTSKSSSKSSSKPKSEKKSDKKSSASKTTKKSQDSKSSSKSDSKEESSATISDESKSDAKKSETPSESEKETASSPESKNSTTAFGSETRKPMGENDSIPFMRTETAKAAQPTQSGSIVLKTFGSVLVVLGLLFVGVWVVKKTGLSKTVAGLGGAPNLKILSSVTPKSGQTLSVIRFGDRTLLVGSTAHSFTVLADGPFEEEVIEELIEADEEDENNGEFKGKPVSVAELLAQDESVFAEELEKAGRLISIPGGRRS